MFTLLIVGIVAGAIIHSFRLTERTPAAIGEVFLVWVLVGYCGLPMLAVSVGILAAPERMAEMLPIGEPTNVVAFFGWAYLGMSLMATLALWFRGAFLIGPAVCWALYFLGATAVHLHGSGAHAMGHGGLLATLATHLLITVLLVVALGASRLWRSRR